MTSLSSLQQSANIYWYVLGSIGAIRMINKRAIDIDEPIKPTAVCKHLLVCIGLNRRDKNDKQESNRY